MDSESEFQKIVDKLRIDTEPNPAHKEKLRREMLSVFETAGSQPAAQVRIHHWNWARLSSHPAVKLAVAATIVLAVFLGLYEFATSGRSAAALAEIVSATEKTPWLYMVIKERHNGQEHTEQHWYGFASKKVFGIASTGAVWCLDYGVGQRLFDYRPSTRSLTISDLPGVEPFGLDCARNLMEVIRSFSSDRDVTISRRTGVHGRTKARIYDVQKSRPGLSRYGKAVGKLKLTLVADEDTNLLLAGEVEFLDEGGVLISGAKWDIDYPQSGPTNLYDLGVPRTAKIIDRSKTPIGTPQPAPTPSQPQGLAPIDIRLPRAMFVGTPLDNRAPNLERPLGRPRPAFLAPAGTTNVALGKPVSSSDNDPIVGELAMVTDGDKEACEGSYVELGPGVQHVTIDLKARYEIYAVVIWHNHKDPRVYFDVVVQICDTPAFRKNVATIFNNDIDDSASLGIGRDKHYTETNEGKLIDARGVQGRYIRLYSNGSTADGQNHYVEVEVYGRPAR